MATPPPPPNDPPHSTPDCCGCCDQALEGKHWVLARVEDRGPFWVHSDCWEKWCEANYPGTPTLGLEVPQAGISQSDYGQWRVLMNENRLLFVKSLVQSINSYRVGQEDAGQPTAQLSQPNETSREAEPESVSAEEEPEPRLAELDEEMRRLPELLTVNRAARALDCTERNIRDRISRGTLPSRGKGTKRRIPRQAIWEELGVIPTPPTSSDG